MRRAILLGGSIFLLLIAASLAWPPAIEDLDSDSGLSLRITDRAGGILRDVEPGGRDGLVSMDELSPAVAGALIAVEDHRFYGHAGIDPLAMARAAWSAVRRGEATSGASTLTMQVARMLRGPGRRGLGAKLLEMHLSVRLEIHHSKEEILRLWLSRAPFGNQAHGIKRAARLYFGKSAHDLTAAEAAFLVGLPQSPSRYNPFLHPERATARQRRVLAAMERGGYLTTEERAAAEAAPSGLVSPRRAFLSPHFVEYVLAAEREKSRTATSAGARPTEIRTTLDPHLQQTVEELLSGHVSRLRKSGLSNAAALVLDNRTGEILAYAGSADFWDERTGGQNDGVRMLRQPGSALKPFTYALALGTGRYTPTTIVADLDLHVPEAGGAFSPDNYDKTFHGPVPVREALASSYNVPAVRLARELGPDALLRALRKAGFSSLRGAADFYGVGLTLGNGEVRLIELARAYAALARGGTLPPLRFERWRRTASGDTVYAGWGAPEPTGLSPEVAYLITEILKDPEARAAAFGRGGPLELPFPCAVKTGTSKDYRDNWAVGYTPRHTVAVWAGNFDGSAMQWVSGISGAGPIFKAIMLTLGSGGAFERPANVVEGTICPASGARPSTICPGARREVFLAGTLPVDTCRVHQLLRIDRRSGLLADASTPPEEVRSERFTIYPPAYHAWMREQGLPLPPTVTVAAVASSDDAPRYTDRMRVEYPAPGARFEIDPVLRSSFQRIRLRGTVENDLYGVAWWINGDRLEADVHSADWRLRPGTHEIELRAVAGDGQQLRSPPVVITVGAAPERWPPPMQHTAH